MTTSTIRLANLLRLTHHYGSLGALARVCESPAYARLLAFTKGHETLDDKAAGTLEQNLNLPEGWLSNPENATHPLPDCLPAGETRRDNSEELQAIRRKNVGQLVGDARGAKSRFTRRMLWYPREYHRLFSDVFGGRRARQIENQLGLPNAWLDRNHSDAEIQAAALSVEQHFSPPASMVDGAATQEVFDNAEGQGPIARALLAKVQRLVTQNRLPEKKAYALLGELLEFEDD